MATNHEPCMHTAEHILNGTMVRMFGCERCFSAHINAKKSKCDYRFDRALTDTEASELEDRINEQILANLDVTEKNVTLQEARDQFNLSRLPEGVETVRIVRIGEYDACPCIGKHVENTKEIGRFKLTTHNWEDGVLRIRFKLVNRD
ncbi:hypothetical protein [Salidesulfovibrio onnuriiensis]|uniref:hypothetical protein n=1 Tax=Salidesulfovibrio onnuriiensis TaxID=2583823 RepID=UPI0011C9832A|nr:hypothetical protein [Salidesulfovibrio onnuriiensis]